MGLLAVLYAGFLGIPAGIIFVPALFISGFPMRSAVAASLAAIIVISSGAAAMSILLDHVSFPFLLFSAGGVTGGGNDRCQALVWYAINNHPVWLWGNPLWLLPF